jgi:hypothetical protein
VQYIEPVPVFLFPIKLTLVVLRAERREQPLDVLTVTNDGARLRARLTCRPLSKDELLLLLLLSLPGMSRRRRDEEGADVTKVDADARGALRGGIFGSSGPLSMWTLCIQRALVARSMTKSEL